MYEKVNMAHPDKIADRIAGAIVDLAYKTSVSPKIAVEVLVGHSTCNIIIETDTKLDRKQINRITTRLCSISNPDVLIVQQNANLASNQKGQIRCGDNGIFKGMPVTHEQTCLSVIAREIYDAYHSDGKYIINEQPDGSQQLIICQSKAHKETLHKEFPKAIINPIGYWTGGINVDTGCTNRKLGSDMGDAVTGGGLHGKDLSKADVSVNIVAHLLAQELHETVQAFCAIGDENITFQIGNGVLQEIRTMPYQEVVNRAKGYIIKLGGFEKLAEWGLI